MEKILVPYNSQRCILRVNKAAVLGDLAKPPGNRLELLQGRRRGQCGRLSRRESRQAFLGERVNAEYRRTPREVLRNVGGDVDEHAGGV